MSAGPKRTGREKTKVGTYCAVAVSSSGCSLGVAHCRGLKRPRLGPQGLGGEAKGCRNGVSVQLVSCTVDRFYIVILRWPVGSRMIHQNTTVIRRVTTVRTERGVRLTVCQGDVS